MGYTDFLKNAGIYSYEEALRIVEGANYAMVQPDTPDENGEDFKHNTPYEAMVLVTPAISKKMGL